ncbi:MAG: arginine deiminase [Anaerovorax sp.]
MKPGVNIYSEIGKLNSVLIHRLGKEVEGLIPDNFERLLFDDIPYLRVAQKEHDAFADLLKKNGVQVRYFMEEAEKSLADYKIRAQFVREFILESDVHSESVQSALYEYFMAMDVGEMLSHMVAGVRKGEISVKKTMSLTDFIREEYPYYTDPIPNLYFTRDPGAFIGNGVSIHCMSTKARKREALMLKYMYLYDKELMPDGTNKWYDYEGPNPVEGGDILVLSPEIVAMGHSQRTTSNGIEIMADNLLRYSNSFKKILVFEIPKRRAFMHLDTVFTMVDFDKFTIHPEIEEPLQIYEVTLDQKGRPHFASRTDRLKMILKKELNLPSIELIRCGGADKMAAQREQWSDGSNTLAIAPGVVITYDRNYVTNDLLDKSGIKVMTIPSSELSRGRGGPRCMSMPINRTDL